MTEEEYKSKVSTAKDTVAKMIEFGEQNDIGAGELENEKRSIIHHSFYKCI